MLTTDLGIESFSWSGSILVADPDKMTRQYCKSLLEAEGYRVSWVDKPEDFLDVYQACQASLILADVELFRSYTLKHAECLNQIAEVIFLVPSCDWNYLTYPLLHEAFDHFVKPLDGLALLHQVHKFFRNSSSKNKSRANYSLEKAYHCKTLEIDKMDIRLSNLLAYINHLEKTQKNMLRNLNHNIRTQLSAIAMALDSIKYMLSTSLDSSKEQYFHNIQVAINTIIHILDDLHFLGQEESETILSQLISIDFAVYCQSLVFEKQKFCEPSYRISFTNDCKEEPFVLVDINLWHQCLEELLDNAIRFSPEGGNIEVSLSQGSKHLILKIQDQGIGIPSTEVNHVFGQFFRASNADSIPGMPGVGMGLAIAQQIVSLHQGTISLHSELNKGTTVTVLLPRMPILENKYVIASTFMDRTPFSSN